MRLHGCTLFLLVVFGISTLHEAILMSLDIVPQHPNSQFLVVLAYGHYSIILLHGTIHKKIPFVVRGEDGVRVRPISSTARSAGRGNRLAVAVGSTGRGCFLMCNYIAARTHFRMAMRLLDSGPGVGPTACEPPRHRRNAPSADPRPNPCPGRTWA